MNNEQSQPIVDTRHKTNTNKT